MRLVSQVFGTKLVDYALKFVTSVLIARALGPTDKGVLTFASLVVTWAVTFGNLSIMDANIFLVSSRKVSLAEAAWNSLLISMGSGLLYCGALFGLVFYRVVSWPVGQADVFFLLLLSIPFTLAMNNSIGILQGLNLFGAYNLFTILRSALGLVGVLVVMWAASQRLLGIAWVTVASNFLGALVLSVYLARRAGWKFPFSKTFLRESFLYGLRGHARVLLMQITVRFDQFALGALLEPKYLGWYSVSVGLAEGLQMLPDSVGMILFPRVASEPGAAGALAARACRCTLLVTLAAAAALALCGKPFVWLLYSKQFLPAVTPLQVLCAAIVFQTASRVLRNYLYGIGRPQLSLWSTGAAAIATVALIFPLVKAYGMVGAALTSLLAQALGAAVDVYLAKRLSGLPAAQFIFPQRSDLRLAARKL